MDPLIKRLFAITLAFSIAACAPLDSRSPIKFVATGNLDEYAVQAGGTLLGTHKNRRGVEEMCGHINDDRTWLVVEDGFGGDSYPKVTAYKITDAGLQKSHDLDRIDSEHYIEYSQGRGLTDPVFLGFDSSGLPKISSATGTHILRD